VKSQNGRRCFDFSFLTFYLCQLNPNHFYPHNQPLYEEKNGPHFVDIGLLTNGNLDYLPRNIHASIL
jgi:hypothetical protein